MEATTTPAPSAHYAGPQAGGRATASVTIGFGLVAVPVSLYTSSESAYGVKRSEFTVDGNPCGRGVVDKSTGELYTGEVVKKAEVDGTWVVVTDDEVLAYTHTEAPGSATVEAFVPLDAIGRDYIVKSIAYARPQATGTGSKKAVNPAAAKAFALLTQAMEAEGTAALVRLPQRGGTRYGALLPDGRFCTLAYATEVRSAPDMPAADVSAAELAMARQLVRSLAVEEAPVLEDQATPKLQEFIAAKAKGAAPAPVAAAEAAPVVDLMAALEASLAVAS